MEEPIKFINLGEHGRRLDHDATDQGWAITAWSFIHLLSGFLLGFFCWLFNDLVDYKMSSSIAVVVLAVWEPLEQALWAVEHIMNQHTDFLIGYIGLYLTLLWVKAT